MVDQSVSQLKALVDQYVADVNTKLAALSTAVANAPSISADDNAALQDMITELQNADTALNPPTTPTTGA